MRRTFFWPFLVPPAASIRPLPKTMGVASASKMASGRVPKLSSFPWSDKKEKESDGHRTHFAVGGETLKIKSRSCDH
jgi:hypothetical protein